MVLRILKGTRLVVYCVAGALALALTGATASAWEFAHGDRDNSGFAGVVTAPAGSGSVSVPKLGRFRPGVGPVIARDGTVYLVTTTGKLIALHADGKPFWSRDITPGQTIYASPAIASDGSIYVIGVQRTQDDSVKPPRTIYKSMLHRFNSTGAWLQQTPFPVHDESGGAALGAPNIWRSGGVEAIMVPAVYPSRFGFATRLIAFSLSGQVLDDIVVKGVPMEVVGGSGWSLGLPFHPRPRFINLVDTPPTPGVGIYVSAAGDSSFLAVSDHYKDLAGYTFSNNGFKEVFRVHHDERFMRTPPVILPSGHVLMSQEGIKSEGLGVEEATLFGVLIATGPGAKPTEMVHSDIIQAAPTRLADGRVVLVTGQGEVIVLKNTKVVARFRADGRSIASAAASNSHVFVATENTLMTYDANSLAEVSRFDWVGGGLHPPAIGPNGQVYAMASNTLFVFPPPTKKPMTVVTQPQSGLPVVTNPGSRATSQQQQQQHYKPPLTANGNRLFACAELDQDDCGKGDHKDISLAWCQKQGYPKVSNYDVDSRKVKAETLDGQFCSKNNCKVFDSIACEM